jgi:hypothetical protein
VVAYPDLGVEVLFIGSAEFGGEINEDRERLELQKEMAKLPKDPAKQDRAKAEELATKAAHIDPGLVHSRDLDRLGEYAYRHPIRIAVLHHPISPLPSTEVTRFAGLLNAGAVKQALLSAGFSIVLHGHVHTGFLAEERWPGRHGGRTLRIAAAPSLGSREIAENNGFNEIEIRRSRDAAGKQSHDIFIRRFARGWGETSLSNTALLCSLHHRYVHEYGYAVEFGDDQRPRFRDPHGRLVAAVPSRPTVADLGWPRIRAANEQLAIDANTIACEWDGNPVDYGAIVGHLAAVDRLR